MTIPKAKLRKISLAMAMPALIAASLAVLGLTAAADPARWEKAGWRTDFSKSEVPFDEILSGGPPKDGIPSIDNPVFVPVTEAMLYADVEPVIEIPLDGLEPRAYPLSVLMFHEIVNDTVSGRPLAITYCPLCNSAVVFERTIEGEVVEFGTTGMLRHSDLVMYDRATETWWQQFTGRAIVGTHAGDKLTMVPSRVVSFSDFRERNPDGRVLVPNDINMRPYGRNPYVNYDGRSEPYPFFQGDLPEGIDPMARVVVVRQGENVTAVALSHLRQEGEIGVDGVTLSWRSGVSSALDTAAIAQGSDVGGVSVVDGDDAPLVHDVTFAFVVKAFHPEASILTEDGWLELARQ
jgi:hypothetical protein